MTHTGRLTMNRILRELDEAQHVALANKNAGRTHEADRALFALAAREIETVRLRITQAAQQSDTHS